MSERANAMNAVGTTKNTIQPFKWQFGIYFTGRVPYRIDPPGWRVFSFYCLKIHTMPDTGGIISSANYHGFWIRFSYWMPFDRA